MTRRDRFRLIISQTNVSATNQLFHGRHQNALIIPKPIDNKQSLSAATWPLETKTKNLSALPCKYVQVRCRSSLIKTGKRSEFIIIIIYQVRTTANVAAICAIVTIMIAQYTFQ